MEGLRQIDSKDILGPVYDAIPGGAPPPDVRDDYLESYAGDRFVESTRFVRAYPTELPKLAEKLPGIQTPVQIVCGRDDPLVPMANSEFLHERLPNNRMDLLPAGHFAWEEVPDLYGDVLVRWLSAGYRERLRRLDEEPSSVTLRSLPFASPISFDEENAMPMIDVYSAEGTFADKHALARDLAAAVMRWEKVPELSLFRKNTAAFVHDLPADSLSNVDGDGNYVRVQVLTPAGVLDREKQLGVVRELTDIVAAAAGRPHAGRAHLGAPHGVTRGRMGDQRAREHRIRHRRGRAERVGRTRGKAGRRPVTAVPDIVFRKPSDRTKSDKEREHVEWLPNRISFSSTAPGPTGPAGARVIERLQADGFRVIAPQFPMTALADDVARLRQVLEFQDGPTIVVGHSYGGQIMTSLGDQRTQRRRSGLHRGLRARRRRVARRAAGAGTRDTSAEASLHRQRGFQLALRGRFRQPLCCRCRPGQGKGDVRRATGFGRVRVHRRDGDPGMEVSSLVVSRRHRRPGHSPGGRACSSPSAWAPRRSRSLPAMLRWSLTPTPWSTSSSRRPRPAIPPED